MKYQNTQPTSTGYTKILPLQDSYAFYRAVHEFMKKPTNEVGMALVFEKLPADLQVVLRNEEISDPKLLKLA